LIVERAHILVVISDLENNAALPLVIDHFVASNLGKWHHVSQSIFVSDVFNPFNT